MVSNLMLILSSDFFFNFRDILFSSKIFIYVFFSFYFSWEIPSFTGYEHYFCYAFEHICISPLKFSFTKSNI